jgi:NADPH:quinone reductase-like Zn-dependent oxidoreductase
MSTAMKAVRVHRFGGPEVMEYEDVERPQPDDQEVLVRIEAAGVGPWDTWIRAGRSALPQPLPLTLGSDLAGVIAQVGCGVDSFNVGDEVYGVTNAQFTGAYAEFAVAKAVMIAAKPKSLSFVEAAAVPVVAVTAWQMLFDHAKILPGQRILILGASGNVGSMAVQLAHRHNAHTIAAISTDDAERMRHLGADEVVDLRNAEQMQTLSEVDAVIDAAGGESQRRALTRLKRGHTLISSVAQPDLTLLTQYGVTGSFFLVKVTTECLTLIAESIDRRELSILVSKVLPLTEAQLAHQMLEGGRPHAPGKIVLEPKG